MNKLTAALISIILCTTVNAEGFNYDYAQVGIGTANSNGYDKEYYVEASKSINNNIAIAGGLAYSYGDWVTPFAYLEKRVSSYYLESLYHKDITPNTNLLASVEYAHSDYKYNCTEISGEYCYVIHPSSTYYIANLGARHKVTNDIEVEGQYKYSKTKGVNFKMTQAKLALVKTVTKKISVGVEHTRGLSNTGFKRYGVFVRRSF